MATGYAATDEVWADGLGASTRPPRRYGTGRVCAQTGCGTILSAYNSDSRCALHSWQHVGNGVDRRPGSRAHRLARTRAARNARQPAA